MIHTFTLILSGPDPTVSKNVDRLFEAGCDDALFGIRDGLHFAEFEREAPTFFDSLKSAICAMEGAIPGLLVSRVEPEELVTAAEIAERTHRSRESVRLLFTGARGQARFPSPVAWLSDRTRLWNWHEVCAYFANDAQATEAAQVQHLINALLSLRDALTHSFSANDSAHGHALSFLELCDLIAHAPRTNQTLSDLFCSHPNHGGLRQRALLAGSPE